MALPFFLEFLNEEMNLENNSECLQWASLIRTTADLSPIPIQEPLKANLISVFYIALE